MKNLFDRHAHLLIIFIGITLIALSFSTFSTVKAENHSLYIPLILASEPATPAECELNSQEAALAELIRSYPEQQHPVLTCDPILTQVAQEKALEMGVYDYFSHINIEEFGPNYLVERAGYELPDFYDQSEQGNNIETLGAGYPTADQAWQAWMASSDHQEHILGLTPFYAEQVDFGIGYAYVQESTYQHYWVVLIARH